MTTPIPRHICLFDSHDGHMLMAIARTKENDDIDNEIVFREFARNELTLERKYKKLKTLANNYRDNTTWRIYISANPRDAKKAHWNFLDRIQHWLRQESNGHTDNKCERMDSYWYSELQKPESSSKSGFIFDIDGDENDYRKMKELLDDYIIHETETPNGWHILTEPFNYTEIETDAEYELKKDDMLFVEKIES